MERRAAKITEYTEYREMDGAIPANVMSLPGAGCFFCGEESRENHGVRGAQKMDGAIPTNAMSLPGAVWFFLWRGEQRKSRSTRSTLNGDVAGRRTTPLEADAQPP